MPHGTLDLRRTCVYDPLAFESDRGTGERRPGRERERSVRAADESPGDLLCATCRARITHEDHRVPVGGSHEHTFVNPGGFVHRIGCFAVATNLSYVGGPETAFSWFPGFSWEIAECMACQTHLGWIFRCAGEQFHGLLLAKLVSRG